MAESDAAPALASEKPDRRWHPSPRAALLCVVGFYVLTRALVFVAGITVPQDRAASSAVTQSWPRNNFMRWDSGHYWAILEQGYPPAILEPDPTRNNDRIAFFPLYPLLTRPLAWVMDSQLALVVVSHVAGLAAVVIFYLWSRRLLVGFDSTASITALRAAMILCAFPTAMYFSTGYSDALFLLLVALALYLSTRGQSLAAAIACGLSSATRPTGVVLAAVLFLGNARRIWQHWRTDISGSRFRGLRSLAWLAALGLISIGGLIAYQAFLLQKYGRIDAYEIVQKNWELTTKHKTLAHLLTLDPVLEPTIKPIKYAIRGEFDRALDPRSWNAIINVSVLVIAFYGLFRPGPIPREVFLLPILQFLMGYLADPYTGGRLLGIARYQLAALPCFLLLAQFGWMQRRTAFATLIGVMLVFQVLYIRGYVNWILVS